MSNAKHKKEQWQKKMIMNNDAYGNTIENVRNKTDLNL